MCICHSTSCQVKSFYVYFPLLTKELDPSTRVLFLPNYDNTLHQKDIIDKISVLQGLILNNDFTDMLL